MLLLLLLFYFCNIFLLFYNFVLFVFNECDLNFSLLFSSASLLSCVVNKKLNRKLCENVEMLYLALSTLEPCRTEKKSESGIKKIVFIYIN